MKKTILILFMVLSNLVFADIQGDVKNNNLEAVKIYLEREEKSKPKDVYKDDLNELLSDAVYYRQTEIEKYLLEKGATYDKALFAEFSSKVGGGRNVEVLLKKGANPNYGDEDGFTVLHMATRDNNIELVKLLLKYGGNPNLEDKHLKNSYALAAEGGHTEMLKILPNTDDIYIN